MVQLSNIILEVFLGAVFSAIVGAFIENRIRLFHRLKKFIAYVTNSQVSIQLTFTLRSRLSSHEIGRKVSNKWKDDKFFVKVFKDTENYYHATNGIYEIDIANLGDRQIVIKTSVLDTTIRRIDSKFSDIFSLIENLQDTKSSLQSLSLTASLPYVFEFVELRTNSNISIEEYDIKLGNNKWKSQLLLSLRNNRQELQINGKSNSEMHEILKTIFKPF